MSDLFAFPSYREGLPVSLMEAMASGLPIVCSNIRGNSDLIEDGKGGYLIEPDNLNEIRDILYLLFSQIKYQDNRTDEFIQHEIEYLSINVVNG
ncbi:glycosyltransferase [Anaerobranca californiensis]